MKYVYVFHNKKLSSRGEGCHGLHVVPCGFYMSAVIHFFCDFMLMTNGIAHFLCLLMEQANYFSFDKCNSSFSSHNICFLTTSWSPAPLVILPMAVNCIVCDWLLYLFFWIQYSDVFSWLTLVTCFS